MKQLRNYLLELSKDELVTDHISNDWSLTDELYGNVSGELDDCYNAGFGDGRISLAREILSILDKECEDEE